MSPDHPTSAWLDPRVAGLPPSATLSINELSARLAREGRTIYRLGLGQSPFPVPEPVQEALRRHAGANDYLPVRGLPALREAVADHVHRHTGLRYGPDRIQVGPGTKELIFHVQLALEAEVVLPSPSWVSYAPQAALAGRPVSWVPTTRADRWTLDPDALERHLATRPGRRCLLVLNHPNNPNGLSIPAERLEALAGVARRHGLLVVSDEIYGLVDHEGTHVSMARYYPEGTLVSTGLSKWCGAGGWRLGALLLPEAAGWLADALAVLAGETFSAVSAPTQHAAVTAFRGGPAIDAYLRDARRIVRALGRRCATMLEAAGLDVDPPEGGFYVFPSAEPLRADLGARGVASGASLCDRLLAETGVAALPGSAFGRPAEELTFRLAYVDFDGAAALAACAGHVAVDDRFLETWCGRVLEAVELVTAWIGTPAAARR